MANFDQINPGDGSTRFVNGAGITGLTMEAKHGQVPNFDKVEWFDDFLGDSLDGRYSGVAGSDSPAAVSFTYGTGQGLLRVITGDSNASVAADSASLTQGLHWKAANGNLVMQTRIKIDVITAVKVYIGFTDTLATTTLEEPMNVTTTSLTTTTSDGCGFIFDTAATASTVWLCAGVKADTDTAITTTTVGPTAATFQTFRIELDTAGTALFYIDGALVATIANAVTPATLLTPVIYARATNTTPKNIDADYLFLRMNRV